MISITNYKDRIVVDDSDVVSMKREIEAVTDTTAEMSKIAKVVKEQLHTKLNSHCFAYCKADGKIYSPTESAIETTLKEESVTFTQSGSEYVGNFTTFSSIPADGDVCTIYVGGTKIGEYDVTVDSNGVRVFGEEVKLWLTI